MAYRVVDVECYSNYFLALALDPTTGQVFRWERHGDVERGRPKGELERMLTREIIVTFNGLGYDQWLLAGYLAGYTNRQLHQLSGWIIKTDMAQWKVTETWHLEAPQGRHIDLMPVAPLVASLKVYAGRLHAPRLQDLPVAPDRSIDEPLREVLIEYCINDLHATNLLHQKLKPQLLLRHRMGQKYHQKLISHSDAKIAETVIKTLLRGKGVEARRPEIDRQVKIRYRAPACLSFISDELRAALARCQSVEFGLSAKGAPLVPKELRPVVPFNERGYQMGIGGLHSTEKRQTVEAGPGEHLTDLDVTSYYPNLILRNGWYPEHLTRRFLTVYSSIVVDRMKAKMTGDQVTADSLKIVVNSSFGKFGNRYSVLYSPKLLLQVTLSGQLYLLMLIEMIELRTSCKVVSANTDGITVHSPNDKQHRRMLRIATEWQTRTGLELEANAYRAVFSRDVNNYLAVKLDGGTKGKGVFATPSLSKNPAFPIVQHAAIKLFTDGVATDDTIDSCQDIRAFVALRKCTGGAIYRDDEVGSTIRWYHSLRGSPILARRDASCVPDASKAMLVNRLPDEFPTDIDYDEYIGRANTLIESVGIAAT